MNVPQMKAKKLESWDLSLSMTSWNNMMAYMEICVSKSVQFQYVVYCRDKVINVDMEENYLSFAKVSGINFILVVSRLSKIIRDQFTFSTCEDSLITLFSFSFPRFHLPKSFFWGRCYNILSKITHISLNNYFLQNLRAD